jgi:hypothetical protein
MISGWKYAAGDWSLPAKEKKMCRNKINEIQLDTGNWGPIIYVWRDNLDAINDDPGFYTCAREDNGFNGRRFVRGILMASELYRRQTDVSEIHE